MSLSWYSLKSSNAWAQAGSNHYHPSSTLTGHLRAWAWARASSNHYSLVRPFESWYNDFLLNFHKSQNCYLMPKVAHLQVVVVVKAVWGIFDNTKSLYLQVNIILLIYKSQNYSIYKQLFVWLGL